MSWVCANWLPALLLGALCPLTAGAIPPPPQQVTANCGSPVYASDQRVCADPELRELDRQVAELIAARGDGAVDLATAGSDEEWFHRSRMCAFESDHGDCVQAAYCWRIAWLARPPVKIPQGCAVSTADYLPVSSISAAGFARGDAKAQIAPSRLWGFVDHGNLYGDDGAKRILGNWWGGSGPDPTTWRFNLKAHAHDPVGASFAVEVPNDLLRDDVLRVFRADAEAGRPTRVYLRGSVFTFEAPTNAGTLTGLRIELRSSRDIGLGSAASD